ncbi:uncharacterized protein E0L32_008477 [Thyridium curvatum]|uniref:Pre-rRNA-processing protein IPI3 n=1 Tax=Thyridium curvatum TaxID=1093900 RepID=A0A507B0F1_9PEZI|nr:uncharacterized protein E0L32_008477 [Thyridium curvatum]TPX10591.1 hypothetical protein E0L32_008477 [Thyridium curvatum]
MLSEEFFSAVCGPPLTSNTAVAKDVGIYAHTLHPTYSVKNTFKKSATPANCLAVSENHVFAAQHEKAYIHVYSRIRGNQEAFIPLPERIRCLTLAGHVLVMGTAEGRLMLWETGTGRLISTPPCHVQAVSCVVATPYHILSGSEDANVHVWSLAPLLQLESPGEYEPDRSLTNHRAAITSLVASQSTALESNLCISASRDKSCIIWNYQTGTALRTVLFPSVPLAILLDPTTRALCVSAEDSSLYLVELLGERPLLGSHSGEVGTAVAQPPSPFGVAAPEHGPATCLAMSYDGTVLLSGHPKGRILRWNLADNSTPDELANLNAAVTNLAIMSPLPPAQKGVQVQTVVKPTQAGKEYTLIAQLDADLTQETAFSSMMNTPGFSNDVLQRAISSLQQPAGAPSTTTGDQELKRQNEELLQIISEQRALYKDTLSKLAEAKAGRG